MNSLRNIKQILKLENLSHEIDFTHYSILLSLDHLSSNTWRHRLSQNGRVFETAHARVVKCLIGHNESCFFHLLDRKNLIHLILGNGWNSSGHTRKKDLTWTTHQKKTQFRKKRFFITENRCTYVICCQ